MATTDTERYVRITLLTFEGGTWISKKILYREVDRTPGSPTLDTLLRGRESSLKQKRNCRDITKQQFEVLLPRSGANTHVDDWDLCLLVKIILYFFHYSLNGQETSSLNEILKIRNDIICHARQPSIQEREFFGYWTKLTRSIQRLSFGFDSETNQYADEVIAKFTRGPLDIQSSMEKLGELCRHDEHMEDVLTNLRRMERGQNQIASGVASANAKLDDVLAGMKKLLSVSEADGGQCRVEIPILDSKVCITGNKEDVVKIAEDILLKVLKSAINKADDPADNENVKRAVKQFLDDIEADDAVAVSADLGSIILNIKCLNLHGLENLLSLFRTSNNRHRLYGIEKALGDVFQEQFQVDWVLPEDTIERISVLIDERLNQIPSLFLGNQPHKKKITMFIQCHSVEAVSQVLKYFHSGDSANRLNQLSEALSEAVNDTVRVDVELDEEGFTEAIQANSSRTTTECQQSTELAMYDNENSEMTSETKQNTRSIEKTEDEIDKPAISTNEGEAKPIKSESSGDELGSETRGSSHSFDDSAQRQRSHDAKIRSPCGTSDQVLQNATCSDARYRRYRRFVCRDCGKFWWEHDQDLKPRSKCFLCRRMVDVKRIDEWADYRCNKCHALFCAVLQKGAYVCNKCGNYCLPFRILPRPMMDWSQTQQNVMTGLQKVGETEDQLSNETRNIECGNFTRSDSFIARLRQFACEDCVDIWLSTVPIGYPVSICYICRREVGGQPPGQETRWAEYECICGNMFCCAAYMQGQPSCDKCGRAYYLMMSTPEPWKHGNQAQPDVFTKHRVKGDTKIRNSDETRDKELRDCIWSDSFVSRFRQFECKDCGEVRLSTVPNGNLVPICYNCRKEVGAIPRDLEYGWAEYECICGTTFCAVGAVEKTDFACYRCGHKCSPLRILPMPLKYSTQHEPKDLTEFEKTGDRENRTAGNTQEQIVPDCTRTWRYVCRYCYKSWWERDQDWKPVDMCGRCRYLTKHTLEQI